MRPTALLFSVAISAFSLAPVFAGDTYFVAGGGLNLATFVLDLPSEAIETDQSFRPGLGLHVGYQAPAGNHATVVTLGYESKGSVWGGQDAFGNDVDVTIQFDYLQLGLQYKLLVGADGAAQAYFAPGVGLAILLSSEAEADGKSEDIEDVRTIDLELGLGMGIQIPVGRNAFFLEGGYGYGLLDTDDESDTSSANNSVIKLRLGFLFGL